MSERINTSKIRAEADSLTKKLTMGAGDWKALWASIQNDVAELPDVMRALCTEVDRLEAEIDDIEWSARETAEMADLD